MYYIIRLLPNGATNLPGQQTLGNFDWMPVRLISFTGIHDFWSCFLYVLTSTTYVVYYTIFRFFVRCWGLAISIGLIRLTLIYDCYLQL